MDVKEIREAIEGLLNAANRNVGGMVPGVVASWCRKALAIIDAPVLEEHDLYVYDDAKPVASDARELAIKVYQKIDVRLKNIEMNCTGSPEGAISGAANLIESFAAERERKAIEAIKRACADAAVKWINEHYVSPGVMRGHPNELRSAILQAEPGQEKEA